MCSGTRLHLEVDEFAVVVVAAVAIGIDGQHGRAIISDIDRWQMPCGGRHGILMNTSVFEA